MMGYARKMVTSLTVSAPTSFTASFVKKRKVKKSENTDLSSNEFYRLP
jgi:hypothetical protein